MEAHAVTLLFVPPLTPESWNSGTRRNATMEELLDAVRIVLVSNTQYLVKGKEAVLSFQKLVVTNF
jgi:hypothetical protein